MTRQRHQTEAKQKLLTAFNSHFLLSDAELSALTSATQPITDVFFDALERAQRIYHDSQVLLGSEDQQLGLEILDQTSHHVNTAFQKLFRWTQRELKTIDLENPQLSHAIRKALRVLAERPQLFQSCLDFFAENREQTLSDAFYAALTGSVPINTTTVSVPSRAIELNAHEPLRYVSDMLAWAHAATVGERQALQILFVSDADEISKSLKAGHERQPWLQADDEDMPQPFDGSKALNDLVDRDLSGVSRQLKQRIEQILHSREDATLAYQISNLVNFYTSIFNSLLGPESIIQQSLQPVTAMALEQFKNITRDHIANLHTDVSVAPTDLSPPDFLDDALDTLKGLMKSYDTSFVGATTAEERAIGFRPVLLEAIDPYLAGCDTISKRMSGSESNMFALNCFFATREVLKGPSYTVDRVDEIDEIIDEHRENLTEAVHLWFVAESGTRYLLEKLAPFADASSPEELQKTAKLKALDEDRLAETAHGLDAFLPGAMEDARQSVGRLKDKMLLRRICEEAADRFIQDFEMAERILAAVDEVRLGEAEKSNKDMEDAPPLLRDVFPRTSDEIRVLLS